MSAIVIPETEYPLRGIYAWSMLPGGGGVAWGQPSPYSDAAGNQINPPVRVIATIAFYRVRPDGVAEWAPESIPGARQQVELPDLYGWLAVNQQHYPTLQALTALTIEYADALVTEGTD